MSKIQRRQEEERRKEMTAASWDNSNTAGDRGRHEKELSEEGVCVLCMFTSECVGGHLSS